MSRTRASVVAIAALICAAWMLNQAPQAGAAEQGRSGDRGGPPRPQLRKAILAWADTRNGIAQHESVSHALAVIERLGYESGAYDTYIRTDSNIIANEPKMTTGAPASGGPSPAPPPPIFFFRPRGGAPPPPP